MGLYDLKVGENLYPHPEGCLLTNTSQVDVVDLMTHYLLKLSLISKPCILIAPSLIASAAVFMSRRGADKTIHDDDDSLPMDLAENDQMRLLLVT